MHSQQQQSERSTRLISVDHQTQIVSKPSIGHSLNLKSSSEAGGFGLKWSWPNLAASWCTCWHNNSFTRDIQTMKRCKIHHYKDLIGFQIISCGKLVMICDDPRLSSFWDLNPHLQPGRGFYPSSGWLDPCCPSLVNIRGKPPFFLETILGASGFILGFRWWIHDQKTTTFFPL